MQPAKKQPVKQAPTSQKNVQVIFRVLSMTGLCFHVYARNLQKKPSTPSFEQWAVQRMQNLNETVEAEVLYSFIADLDSPNDVGFVFYSARTFQR